jgi:hypothetical protein
VDGGESAAVNFGAKTGEKAAWLRATLVAIAQKGNFYRNESKTGSITWWLESRLISVTRSMAMLRESKEANEGVDYFPRREREARRPSMS